MNAQKFQLRYSQVENRVLTMVTDEDDREGVLGLTRDLVKRLVSGPSFHPILFSDPVGGPISNSRNFVAAS